MALLCHCHVVSERGVEDAVLAHGAMSVDDVVEHCGAGWFAAAGASRAIEAILERCASLLDGAAPDQPR